MSIKQILPGLYQIPGSYFNVFLVDAGELILVDAGAPNHTKAIQEAVQAIGRQIADIRHILVTHCHRDHAGGLAAVKQITGAPAYMHPIDAAAVRMGRTRREYARPAPDLINKIAALDFETACFCHGKTIVHGASAKFKQKMAHDVA